MDRTKLTNAPREGEIVDEFAPEVVELMTPQEIYDVLAKMPLPPETKE